MEGNSKTLTDVAAALRDSLKSAGSSEEMKAMLRSALDEMAEIERDLYNLEKEAFGKWKKEHKRWMKTSRVMSEELPNLLCEVKAVVSSLHEDGPFELAPAEVQERLRNRKEGLEIICRMVERLPQRQAQLEGNPLDSRRSLRTLKLPVQSSNAQLDGVADSTETAAAVQEILEDLQREEEQVRDENYEFTREVRLESERLKRAISGFLKDHLLPVFDGVERGIWDEEVLKEPLNQYEESQKVIAQWFEAYHDCSRLLNGFAKRIRLVRLKAKRGMEFHPEWHMALGTDSSPDLQDDQVLEVLRSGWQLHGNPIRPAEVLVVKNRAGGKDGS